MRPWPVPAAPAKRAERCVRASLPRRVHASALAGWRYHRQQSGSRLRSQIYLSHRRFYGVFIEYIGQKVRRKASWCARFPGHGCTSAQAKIKRIVLDMAKQKRIEWVMCSEDANGHLSHTSTAAPDASASAETAEEDQSHTFPPSRSPRQL